MAIGKPLDDFSSTFNSLYNVTLDVSGWDKVTIHAIAPVLGTINVMGSNDSGAQQQNTFGNAELAINFSQLQATNLATGTKVNAIYGAGLFEVDVNARFLRLSGAPAQAGTSIYRLLLFNSKVG